MDHENRAWKLEPQHVQPWQERGQHGSSMPWFHDAAAKHLLVAAVAAVAMKSVTGLATVVAEVGLHLEVQGQVLQAATAVADWEGFQAPAPAQVQTRAQELALARVEVCGPRKGRRALRERS